MRGSLHSIKIAVNARTWPARDDALGALREASFAMPVALARSIADAGAVALMMPPITANRIDFFVDQFDALLLQGGGDVAPALYDETPLDNVSAGDPEQDELDIALTMRFVDAGKPVLGICRGCQLINVAFGGSLCQDLPSQLVSPQRHSDPSRYVDLEHDVRLAEDGMLRALYGVRQARVNSAHRQGIRRLGENLVVEATTIGDGLIEAFSREGSRFIVGVQWHPEFQSSPRTDALPGATLFRKFVSSAREQAHA